MWDGANTIASQATGKDTSFSAGVEAGTYYVYVDPGAYSHSDEEYGLTVTSTQGNLSGVETEDNDSLSTADMLSSGQQIKGQLASSSDRDVFSITTSSSGILKIDLDAPTNSYSDYFNVSVYDRSGNILAAQETGKDTSFSVEVESAGTYFVGLTASDYHNGEQYSLTILTSYDGLSYKESESNNTMLLADSVEFEKEIKGQLSSYFDNDIFVLTTASAGSISIDFYAPTNSTYSDYFYVSLYDSSGNVLDAKTTGKDTSFSSSIDAAGNYYVEVQSSSNYIGDEYNLTSYFEAKIIDDAEDDILQGTRNSDVLEGTSGDDIFGYIGGNDIIYASAGEDTLSISGVTKSEFELKQISNLLSLSSVDSSTFGDVSIRVLDLESVTWAGNTTEIINTSDISFDRSSIIFGTVFADKLVGTEGQDFIDGLGGSDIIDGGAGTDYLVVFESSNNISLSEVSGIFRLSSHEEGSDYYTSATKFYNVENLLLPNNNISLVSSDLTNLKIYGAGSNSIAGTQLDDILDGGGGSDIIDGQLGHDTVIFFTSINDAKVEIDSVNDTTTVAYKSVDQEEYAFSETILYSIEKIKFIDGEYEILTGDLFEVSLSSTKLVEGGEAVSLKVKLTAQPSSDVSVSISSEGLIFDNSQMVFTSNNWHALQTIVINVQNNDTYEGDRDHLISFALDSDDINFNLHSPNKLTVTVKDDEEPLLNNFIQGRLWEDRDKDGQIDTNESGLANREVFIDSNHNHSFDNGEASVTTDTQGYYRFSDLDIGTYSVGLVSDFGWQYTFPSMTASSAIATSLSETVENFEIGSTSYFQDVSNSKYSLRPDLNTPYSDLDGTGQTVVIIDSGIDTDHSYFDDRIILSKTFGNGLANGEDVGGHGTHVAGIIASSDDKFSGVAPNANIIALKVFDTEGGNVVQQALQWCVANAAEYSIDAINLSLGVPLVFNQTDDNHFLDLYSLGDEFSALSELGVICVAAAGNNYAGVRDGQTGAMIDYYVVNGAGELDWYTVPAGTHSVQGISAPAAYPEVISVGATWGGPDSHLWGSFDANNGVPNANSILHFSQRDDDILDVVAYGGGITSAAMGGGSVALSGTSMAAPYVTGLVLLMQEAAEQELGRKLSVDEIRTIINISSNQNFDGDDENYTTQNPSNVSYNEASINNWIDQIASLKDPQFHSVDLNQGQSDRNFGLVSANTNAFTNKSEQVIVSTAGTETFAAGGNDYLIGSVGSDTLHGGQGDDRIEAGAGDDTLYGGQGDDMLTGGAGSDTFSYTKGDGNDIITDFDAGTDTVEYTGYSDHQKTQFVRDTTENGDTLITLTDDAIITLKNSNSPAAGNLIATTITDRFGNAMSSAEAHSYENSVNEITATSTTDNVTVFETASGSDVLIAPAMAIDTASDKAIGAFDALQALRLAVGLDKSDGTSEWHDYIAADINKDGRVGADDALNILKYAVGLTDGPPIDWVFIDKNADWSGIDRSSTTYNEGIQLSDITSDTSIDMTGILVGDVDGSYIA